MLIGYMRPYEDDKKCQKQFKLLTSFNCKSIYFEQHIYSNNRIELNKMISKLNKDDKIIVTKFYSIADSIRDLFNILEQIKNKGAFIMFI
ncbi:recombinase family protein [Niallia taxi]|nr:recombinase family protein [Niallia taxi]MDE5053303.1 recombinase family protein [Niallia taxi]